MRKIYELAIVGAGPAGISMAVEARYADIPADRIVIFEKGERHSRAIRVHYAADKLVTENYKGYDVVPEGALGIATITKDQTIEYLERAIAEYGLSINYGEGVISIKRLPGRNGSRSNGPFEIRTDRLEPAGHGIYLANHCAIAIGILEKPNKPDYPLPRSLKPRIHHDIPPQSLKDIEFLVVGGGDTAFERAARLVGMGKNVTLSYRGGSFHRMCDDNSLALSEMEQAGKMKILRHSNIAKVEIAAGKPKVTFADSNNSVTIYDHLIYCLGGATPVGFLESAGVEIKGDMPVMSDSYETSVPGLFLIGDLSAGLKGGSVNWAFNSSHAAIRRITDKIISRVLETAKI
jgi:thioredoxin reductase (NADPH)